MAQVVCFGELMLRLAPMGYGRIVQADTFEATYGGGEANVAVSLANYGVDAAFVSKFPENLVGDAARNSLRKYGVDVSHIARGGERLGIYYCEKGASMRPSCVIYDRAHSAIAEATREDFDWDAIFDGAEWFHFTGITPALGDNVAEICKEACQKAKEHGLTVSCDLNFRKKLWTSEKAGKVMGELMQYVDVLVANEEDAEKVFGISAPETEIVSGKISEEGYKAVAKELCQRFGIKKVAITLRESISASDNGWSALYWDGKDFLRSKRYDVRIVDRVGGGDSFGGGLIYASLNHMDSRQTIEFAVAASALKHTIEGDFNMVFVKEVETLMGGDGSGRVQR